jgi:hypothetical protein
MTTGYQYMSICQDKYGPWYRFLLAGYPREFFIRFLALIVGPLNPAIPKLEVAELVNQYAGTEPRNTRNQMSQPRYANARLALIS